MAQNNPFSVGGAVAPALFQGRDKALHLAFDQILNGSHLSLFGEPGVGKSSLLTALADPSFWRKRKQDPAGHALVYVDSTNVRPFTRAGFWREALSRLEQTLPADEITIRAALQAVLKDPGPVSNPALREVLRLLGEKKKHLVLLLDDFEAALYPTSDYTETQALDFLYEIRALGQRALGDHPVSFIVSSFRPLDVQGPKSNLPSPWYNQYLYYPLRVYDDQEIESLFNCMPPPLVLSGVQRDAVREIAGGHPALLQCACRLLHDHLSDKQSQLTHQEFLREFVSRMRHHFQRSWALSNEREQMLLMLAALARLDGRLSNKRSYNLRDIALIFSQMNRDLLNLQDRGLLRKTLEHGRPAYVYHSSIMEWWVINEIENSPDEAAIQARERVFGGLLSRGQVAYFTGVVREVWNRKDAIEAVVEWSGKLAGAFFKGAKTAVT